MASNLTIRPIDLPDVDRAGYTSMARWRHRHSMTSKRAAEYLGVSVATYYRYEAGFRVNMNKANAIVRLTNGEVRYRDIVGNFIPEYA